jgi:hypothetical protein
LASPPPILVGIRKSNFLSINDKIFLDFNKKVEAKIDVETKKVLEGKGFVAKVELPVFFMGPDSTKLANISSYTVNLVNFQVLKDERSALPKTFVLDKVNGALIYPFEKDVPFAESKRIFIDDFETFHVLGGEVHCGSNALRLRYSFMWWKPEEDEK